MEKKNDGLAWRVSPPRQLLPTQKAILTHQKIAGWQAGPLGLAHFATLITSIVAARLEDTLTLGCKNFSNSMNLLYSTKENGRSCSISNTLQQKKTSRDNYIVAIKLWPIIYLLS